MDDTNTAGLVEQLIGQLCKDVAELPDRDSPDDWPEAMLVTGEELEIIARRAFAEAAATLTAQAAEIARLKGVVTKLAVQKVVRLIVDLAEMEPDLREVLLCSEPAEELRQMLARNLTGSQSHDLVSECLKTGTDAVASQLLAAEVDLLMNGDPAAKPKPWGSQSHD